MRFSTLCITTFGTLIAVATACSSDGGTTDATGGTSSGGGVSTGGTVGSGGGPGTGGTGTGGTAPDCKDEGYATAEEAGLTVGVGTYDYGDPGGSCVALSATAGTGEICISGSAAQVVNNMWDTIWGAGIGIKMAEDTGTFDASGYAGISFTLSNLPAGLRAGVMMSGDTNNYFTTELTAGENTIFFEDLKNGDWVTPAGTLDPSVLVDIQWQVPSTDAAAVEFDFCVSDVEFVGGGGAGGMGGTAG